MMDVHVDALNAALHSPKAVALGEIGLDYSHQYVWFSGLVLI